MHQADCTLCKKGEWHITCALYKYRFLELQTNIRHVGLKTKQVAIPFEGAEGVLVS